MNSKIKKSLVFLPISAMLITGCGGSSDAADANNNTEVNSESNTESAAGTEATSSTPTSTGPISLKVWGAEEDAELLQTVCTNFKAAYPDYQFEFTIEPCAESDSRDTVLGDVQNAADVFTFADDQLSSLVASGLLKEVENSDEIKARNSDSSVSAASVNDVLYAYPLTADNGYFLYYNKKYFKDSDLTTLDGILKVCADNGKQMTFDMSSGWYLYSFFGNTGLTVGLNEDGISNYCTWNATDGAIKGTDVIDALTAVAHNSGFKAGGDSDLTAGAENDTVIAGVSGVWLSTSLQEIWGNNLGAVKLPTYTVANQQVQLASYAGYKMVGVNSYSANVEWAAKFADFLSNEDNQNLRFEMRGQGPSNSVAASSEAVKNSPAIVALLNQSEFASLQRIGGTYWGPAGDFGNAILSGNFAGLSKQEFMDKIVNEICGLE